MPADNRDLNYDLFYKLGNQKTSTHLDYSSNNVKILNVKEVEKKLRTLSIIKDQK